MKYLITSCFFALYISIGCEDMNSESPLSDEERLIQLKEEIDELIKDNSCNGDDDCRTMAIGHKPCGGPATYIIYAGSSVDEAVLTKVVQEYSELQQKINIDTGAVSDCSIVGPPTIGCVAGRCSEQPG